MKTFARLSFAAFVMLSTHAQAAETKELVKPALSPSAVSSPGTTNKPTDGANGSTSSNGPGATAIAVGDSSVDKIARVPTTADDQKTQRILNSLATQSGWFPKLKIQVVSGMVTIEGEVKDADQLAWLAKTADRLPTVIAVINKASVDQPAVTDLTPAWSEFKGLMNSFKRSLPLILLAAVLITLFWFFSRFVYSGIHTIWGRHIDNPFLLETVTKITMIPVWLVGFYLVLETAGLSGLATTIIGGTGALGLVVGFAFKDIAENYLSGLLLAIRSPFTKGDDVTVAGYDGYIQALNMRGTTILSYDGTLILVPNSIVIQQVIKNRTTNPKARLSFNVGIGYDDNAASAIDLIYKGLGTVSAILKDPSPLAIAYELSTSSVNIQVRFWIDSTKSNRDKVKSNAIACVKEILLANGISLPDGDREIVFADTLKIQQVEKAEDAKAVESQRLETVREKATKNLTDAALKPNDLANDVADDHAEQIKKLGDNVDIMDSGADRKLLKNVSV